MHTDVTPQAAYERWDRKTSPTPRCTVCGTTENLHKDGLYGYRCGRIDCMVF